MKLINSSELKRLPPPQVIEELDPEQIKAEMIKEYLAEVRETYPDYVLTPADPAYKLLAVAAKRETTLRQRINQRLAQSFIAHARGDNLEGLVKLNGTDRLPKETDDELIARYFRNFDANNTAGCEAGYKHHAFAASAGIEDVAVSYDRDHATVKVYLLYRRNMYDFGGIDEQEQGRRSNLRKTAIEAVYSRLYQRDVKPLCDSVVVNPATLVNIAISPNIKIPRGMDKTIVEKDVTENLERYIKSVFRCGHDIYRSAITAACFIPGMVIDVELAIEREGVLQDPLRDVALENDQAPNVSIKALTYTEVE